MNWSSGLTALVPPELTTVTSTVPVPAGEIALIDVGELTLMPLASREPNSTARTSVKLEPLIVTAVPPPHQARVWLHVGDRRGVRLRRERLVVAVARAAVVGGDDPHVVGRDGAQARHDRRNRDRARTRPRQRRARHARPIDGRGAIFEVTVAHRRPLGVHGRVQRRRRLRHRRRRARFDRRRIGNAS